MNDILGQALTAFYHNREEVELTVYTDISLPEITMASYFFRRYDQMNPMEQLVMDLSEGTILDIGAGAGCHAVHLQNEGNHVTVLERSEQLVSLLAQRGLENVVHSSFMDFGSSRKYDTIYSLMNGIGISGRLDQLPAFLMKCMELLSPSGTVYIDSSDISHLLVDEHGTMAMDLSKGYPGDVIFTIEREGNKQEFPWLFVDRSSLSEICDGLGIKMEVLMELGESYLARLTQNR